MVRAAKIRLGLPNGGLGIDFIYNYVVSDNVTLDRITERFTNAFSSAFESFFNSVSSHRYSNDPNFVPPNEEQLVNEEELMFTISLARLTDLNVTLENQDADILKLILITAADTVVRRGGLPADFQAYITNNAINIEMIDNDVAPMLTEADIDRNSRLNGGQPAVVEDDMAVESGGEEAADIAVEPEGEEATADIAVEPEGEAEGDIANA